MSDRDTQTPPEYLPIGDVAGLFNVTVATVRAWDAAGKLTSIRTPGGQRRFKTVEVAALLPTSEICAHCGTPLALAAHRVNDEDTPERAWCSDDCRDNHADRMAESAAR